MARLIDTLQFRNAGFVQYSRIVANWLISAGERSRQRRALRRLDDAQLKDIGLTRDDIDAEAGQAFWRF